MSLTELAARKGVRKQSLAEKVTRLEAQGLLTTQPGKGRAKLINVAAFDRAVGQVADLAREQGAATRRRSEVAEPSGSADPDGPIYTREQARHIAYKADMAQLDLEERRGNLIRADAVRASALEAARAIVRPIEALIHRTDELVLAAHQGGAPEMRTLLRKIIYDLRSEIADAIDVLRTAGPRGDPSADERPFADPGEAPTVREALFPDWEAKPEPV